MKKLTSIGICIMVIVLSGCVGGSSPEGTVKTFFNQLVAGDIQGVKEVVSNPEKLPEENTTEFNKLMSFGKTIQYEILEVISKGETEAVLNVKVANMDMSLLEEEVFAALTEYIVENPKATEGDIKKKEEELSVEIAQEGKLPYTSKEIKFSFIKEEGDWKIGITDVFLEIILGI